MTQLCRNHHHRVIFRCNDSADHHRVVVFRPADSADHHIKSNVGPFSHDDSASRSQRAKEISSQKDQAQYVYVNVKQNHAYISAYNSHAHKQIRAHNQLHKQTAHRSQQFYWAVKMRIRPPELETSICDVKYHVSLPPYLATPPSPPRLSRSPPLAAAPPPLLRDRTCSDHLDEEIPFVPNSSGLLVQAVEGILLPVVDLIKEFLPPPTVKSQIPCEFGWSQAPRRQQGDFH
ncbi:hypothetical protein F511_29749 [Dorcoceras hygrometricum]|uniref:Uncharacterized protein n=1 Tax=Dorcoceras hygrometricum TaxID=472368 RepID=A0A2Z7BJH5_9LAMI|nr:hypothetical protein F511_29749 [Dorcoceras hygrometricum]